MRIGGREFDTENHTYVCGILNVTPDSFSDGGRFCGLDGALDRVEQMIAEGADLIDVGGESTRPGFTPVPAQEEIERVAPVIEAIRSRFDIPISLDTYKGETARAGIAAGADLINDVGGLRQDTDMAGVIAESGLPCCLMHSRREADYVDFLPEVLRDLRESVRLARTAGIAEDRILLDPGIGFGKSYEQNLCVLKHLESFRKLGYPLLLGCSRKSVIGLTLQLPTDQREEGTLVTTVLAVMNGVRFVRVHNVEANVRAVRMAEAILGAGEFP